jgi:siroheme decarboxylase
MTDNQRSLLNMIQHDFPLEPRPFLTLGKRLGISEKQCIGLLKQFIADGILRAIRMVISWNKIGFSTVLVGMKVDPAHIETVAAEISRVEEVTHNYARQGSFNLWFTLIYDTLEKKKSLFDSLRHMDGVEDIREFKAEKTYKIGLVLDV